VEKYQFRKHGRKQTVLRRLMDEETADWLSDAPRPCQGPDLLAYAPDYRNWFFVEVKGPRDRLRSVQRQYFEELKRVTGREVHVARFRELI